MFWMALSLHFPLCMRFIRRKQLNLGQEFVQTSSKLQWNPKRYLRDKCALCVKITMPCIDVCNVVPHCFVVRDVGALHIVQPICSIGRTFGR